MTQRIIYFTAGPHASIAEVSEIAQLNDIAEKPYDVTVVNAQQAGDDYGEGRLIPGDFVAGAVPASYEGAYPTFDPDNPPAPPLPDDKAIVTDGESFTVDGGTVTLAVTGGVVSAQFTPTD